jgi:hypothetical protein
MSSVVPNIEIPQIDKMYTYLTEPVCTTLPGEADVAFVFGRKSEHLLQAAAEAAMEAMTGSLANA